MKKELKFSTIVGYGAGHFGYGFISQTLASYLFYFATVVLLMKGSLIGLVVSVSIVWDAISDPLMGYISDRTKSRFGKRHIYILIGTLMTAIINMILWLPSKDFSMWTKFIWLLLSVFLLKTFITVFITPYYALGAEMSDQYHERTKIQMSKSIGFLLSIVLVTTVCMLIFFKPTTEYQLGQMNPNAYKAMAVTGSLLMLISGAITYYSTRAFKHVKSIQSKGQMNFVQKVSYSLKSENFRVVLLAYLSTNTAAAFLSVVGLHMYTYTFRLDNVQIGFVLGFQFFVCIATQPLWYGVTKILDKKKTMLLGTSITIFACSILWILSVNRLFTMNHLYLLYLYSGIIGFGTSPLFSIPGSMVADIVDEQEYNTGERNEGVYYGMLNFGYKVSQSIAIFILGIILDFLKFDPEAVVQTHDTSIALGVLLAVGSLICFSLAFRFYLGYDLNKSSVEAMQTAIKNRLSKDIPI